MSVTVPQTQSNLLSYFQTGDTPTQDQFEELIRTMFHMYQQAVTAAEEAAASAAAAEELVSDEPTPVASGRIDYDGPDNASELVGCTVAMNYSGNSMRTQIALDSPLDNDDWFFIFTVLNGSNSVITTVAKTTNGIVIDSSGDFGYDLRFRIFPYSRWYDLLNRNNLLPAP